MSDVVQFRPRVQPPTNPTPCPQCGKRQAFLVWMFVTSNAFWIFVTIMQARHWK